MTKEDASDNRAVGSEPRPFRVRLPGFVSDEDVGLGDLVRRVTSSIGIKPCGACGRRAGALNRRLAFSGRRSG